MRWIRSVFTKRNIFSSNVPKRKQSTQIVVALSRWNFVLRVEKKRENYLPWNIDVHLQEISCSTSVFVDEVIKKPSFGTSSICSFDPDTIGILPKPGEVSPMLLSDWYHLPMPAYPPLVPTSDPTDFSNVWQPPKRKQD